MFSLLKIPTRQDKITKIHKLLECLDDENIDKIKKYCKTLHTIHENTNKKKRYSYNQRLNEYDPWDYMTKDVLMNHKKMIEESTTRPYYDIKYRSRFNNVKIFSEYDFLDIFGKENHRVIMADYLMFNPYYKLEYEHIDRLLSYCKYKEIDEYTYKIDGWVFKQTIMYGKPNYTISYDDSDYDNIEFIQNDLQKRLAVRLFIQVMNETPDEFVNFHNYNVIAEWYNKNDSLINSYRSNMYTYNENIKNRKLNDTEKIDQDDLKLVLDDKFTIDELTNLLKSNAKYSKSEFYLMGLYDIDPEVIEYNNLNTKELDLTEYYKVNGYTRTKSVIDHIKYNSKHLVNCDNYLKSNGEKITKPELLAMLYNSNMPFGMGVFDSNDKTLTVEKASSILEKMNYFDYLHGVAMKIRFSNFPIMNFERFDKYNGDGKFMECIRKIQGNESNEKEKLTSQHVNSQIYRMIKDSFGYK